MKTDITNRDGSVSAYGLACGYIDKRTRQTESGDTVEITLAHNSSTYDVDVRPNSGREWVDLPSGGRIMAGWAQFDTLTEARDFQRRLMSPRVRTVGDAYAHCLAVMA